METWENINFTVETQPYTKEFQQDEAEIKPKYKWNWRINQLALPKSVVPRFETLQTLEHGKIVGKIFGKIDPECEWRSNQLANAKLLRLIFNKNEVPNTKIKEILNKHIEDTRNSIYYYYYKKRRDIKLKKLAAKLKRLERKKQKLKSPTKAEIEKRRQEYLEQLAQPRPKIEPEPIPKIWRHLDELWSGVLRLAQPRTYIVFPPKMLGVSPQALKYQITSHTELLAQVPEFRRYVPPPPPPEPKKLIKVKDMKIILSERMKEISQPRPRSMKKDEDLKENPWSISPTALKYKATPRIIELSKPIERD